MSLMLRNVLMLVICIPLTPCLAQWCTVTDSSLALRRLMEGPSKATGRNIHYVPVVFNVLYQNAAENISDNQLLSQLEVINEDFSATNANLQELPEHWRQLAGDTGIRFCLFDDGNGGTPIRRRKVDPAELGDLYTPYHQQFGGIDAIDPQRVLNIWIMRLDGHLTGYANPIHQYGPLESGVVVDYEHTGRLGASIGNLSFNLGRTLTHEIGHYFGLLHIWGNIEDDCLEDDLVEDTPIQREALFDCPQDADGCFTKANIHNYMDLVDDYCMAMFTKGQANRMNEYIATYLPEISNNTPCITPDWIYKPFTPISVDLFPNPNNGAFTVQNNTGMDVSVTVLDATGQVVFSDLTQELFHLFDLSRIVGAGIYFVVMSQQSGTTTHKMIITH